MPKINIHDREYSYEDDQLVTFEEGLIGLPEMNSAVLIPIDDLAPFQWLACPDSERSRFIVIDPREVFPDYQPLAAREKRAGLEMLVIAKISSDWSKTTFNLRAPIFIEPETRSGTQLVLTESHYHFAEALPQG